MSFDATALVAHVRLDASDIPVETPPKAPPGTRRPRKPPRVIPSPPPPTPQCAGACKEYSRRGTNATVERFTCVDCGFVTTLSKGATEDPAMCPHVETDTRGSSKTLMRHTCKACLKVILELPRNEATVRESTAKDVSRADTSQFRDISRPMHVRPQMTLNAREVDLVLGLLTRNVHVHLSRLSSISGTDFVSLLDDAIESILDPTETVTARNTGTTITTNDTSSGATSSLSASQSGAATQPKAFVAYCSNNTELQNVFVSQPPQLLAVQTLVMAVDADGNEIGQRCDQSLDSPFDPCQGQSDSPSVSLQEQQVTSSDSLRGQSAMPRVSAQQIDSDDEETAFFLLQNLLSLTRNTMSESGPRWTKVATPLVTARVGQLVQNDLSTCLVFSRSIARAPETRFSLDLVAIRLPQLDVASFRLHLPSLLNVATSITCQALLSRGSCLVMDLSCSRSMPRPS